MSYGLTLPISHTSLPILFPASEAEVSLLLNSLPNKQFELDPIHTSLLKDCPHLSFSNHISNLSRSCFMHIRDLRRIRPMLDFKTASTIATSIVHSKLDYCNSLFLSLDSTQIQRLQLIENSLPRGVTRTPRHHHITPVLKSLHWL